VDDEAFIGSGAIVLARTHIGNGSIVGMGAIVTKDVCDHTLVYGVPAREIRKIDEQFDWKKVL
jgi:acetyltransferase-like isoleucine patch superfamily enzyme